MSKKTPPATAATISFPAAPERMILRNQRRQRMVATASTPMASWAFDLAQQLETLQSLEPAAVQAVTAFIGKRLRLNAIDRRG